MPNRPGVNSRRAQTLVAVREMILRGELAPRKTIEEIELSKKLGASRPIVRATLEKLHAGRACWKNCPTADTRLASSLGRISPTRSRRAVRWRVWPPALAARRVTDPAELDPARRIQAELVEATASFCLTESPTVEQMAGFGELNLAFHQALIALAKSPMLQLALDRVQSIAFASPAAVVTPAEPGGYSRAIREHEEILHAIQTGDALRAEKLVREHARFALRGVKNALDRPGHLALKPKVDSADRGDAAPKSTPHQAELAGPTSELVLDAAAALFGEKGFSETTTRAIAARLNIHQASLYYHISTKEDLLYRINRLTLETVEQHVRRAIENHHNARDRLSALIHAHLQGLFENPNRALAAISEYRSLSRAHHRELTGLRGNYSDLLDQGARIGRESRHRAQGHSRLSPSARPAELSELDATLVSPLRSIASRRARRNLRPRVFRGDCRPGPTKTFRAPTRRIRGGHEPARHTAELSASSFAPRLNYFRNRVTHPPARDPSRH